MAKSLGFAKAAWRVRFMMRHPRAYRLHNWAWRYITHHGRGITKWK